MNNLAIIIPASPKSSYDYGPSIGLILEHSSHIQNYGKVIWGLIPSNKNSNDFKHNINKGYFYDTSEKAVTHAFEIEKIIISNELKRNEKQYLIESRKQYYEKGFNEFYIFITNIYRLKNNEKLSNIKKASNLESIQNIRNYCIAIDPNFSHHNKNVSRQEIMSDYIVKLLLLGKITEQNVEDLLIHCLSNNGLSLVSRQGTFNDRKRLDLLYKNNKGKYILYEIKKGNAPLSTLEQIKNYMKSYCNENNIDEKQIEGIILCKDAEPKLFEAIKKEKNIKIKRYFFEIGVKD